jgi:hypothetical protein
MPLQMDYVAAEVLKETLELAGSSFADADVQAAVSAASQWIDQSCGRSFGQDDTSDVVRKFIPVNGGYALIDDLCEFDSLVDQSGSAWTIEQDFFLEPINAAADGWPYTAIRSIGKPFVFPMSSMQQGWAGFDGRIAVTGKWGWPAVPAPIVEATSILAGRLLNRSRTPNAIAAMGLDGTGVRIPRVDPDVQAMIGPFTRMFIA